MHACKLESYDMCRYGFEPAESIGVRGAGFFEVLMTDHIRIHCARYCIRVSYSTDGAEIYRACNSSKGMTVLHCAHTLLHDICDNQHFRDLSPYVVRCHCLQAGERMDRRDCRRDCRCDSSTSSIAFRKPRGAHSLHQFYQRFHFSVLLEVDDLQPRIETYRL